MSEPLQAGEMGEPLPGSETVFRLIKLSKDGVVTESSFILSSEDQNDEFKSLSVWALGLTSAQEAREFFGPNKVDYQVCAFFNVDAIRSLRPEPDSEKVAHLNVVWHPLLVKSAAGDTIPDPRTGASGHCGITGLMRTDGVERSFYKSLRSQLAKMANSNKAVITEVS